MSSRRKSFIPCMVRETLDHSESVLLPTLKDDDDDDDDDDDEHMLNPHREHEDCPPTEGPFNTCCSFSANSSETLSYQHPDKSLHSFQRRTETEAQAHSPLESVMMLKDVMCHVTPALQRPPNLSTTPTLAVPLYTNTYNPDLDSNSTLMASFNRFPYPTHAELSWLTAASKHPEEQIRVWFTTQRLKQGITWSPEEVEEARKKLFDGSTSPHKHSRSSGHVTGTGVSQTRKRSLQTPLQRCSEIKRWPALPLCVMPPPPAPASPVFPENKTSSSASFLALHFRIPAVASPMVSSKEKIPVARPKQRLPLTPIVSANLKRFPSALTAHVNRSTVIQTPCFPDAGFESLRLNGDARIHHQNTAHVSAVRQRSQFPLLESVKDKSPGQMKLLEASFQRNGFPSFSEAEHLATTTRLSREEIERWFLERRALRDDLEQALLNSMGSCHTAHKHADAFQSVSLLKNVLAQTRWPVEPHKGFARTDFVRRFRDHGLDRSSGFLEQDEMSGERRPLTAENTKPNSSEIEECFTRSHQSRRWPDASAGEGALGGIVGIESHELRWFFICWVP